MKHKKKTKIREGSIAWYVSKYWKLALYVAIIAVLALLFASCTLQGELDKANTQPPTEKPIEANFEPSTVEEMICVECDKYGIDPKLPLAIAKFETGHFTSEAYTEGNNVGGLSHDEQPVGFPTLERGVEAFVANLYHNYYEQGLDTPEKMAGKYCPLQKANWAESVTSIMNE